VQDGDHGAPNFIVVSFSKSWADLDEEPDPSFWKMVETPAASGSHHAMRKSLGDVIQDQSSHVDSCSADLTYLPAGK
jgi:hypothetical protein